MLALKWRLQSVSSVLFSIAAAESSKNASGIKSEHIAHAPHMGHLIHDVHGRKQAVPK